MATKEVKLTGDQDTIIAVGVTAAVVWFTACSRLLAAVAAMSPTAGNMYVAGSNMGLSQLLNTTLVPTFTTQYFHGDNELLRVRLSPVSNFFIHNNFPSQLRMR